MQIRPGAAVRSLSHVAKCCPVSQLVIITARRYCDQVCLLVRSFVPDARWDFSKVEVRFAQMFIICAKFDLLTFH